MATIEIHDGKGGVVRRLIDDDRPLLFGTSKECDIVLPGPGVFPVHGRMRIKDGKMKVQASPASGALDVNGKLVEAKSLAPGDELRLGAAKIYLVNLDVTTMRGNEEAAQAKPFEEMAWAAALDLAKPAPPSKGPKDKDDRPMLFRSKGKGALPEVDEQYDKLLKEAQIRKAQEAADRAEKRANRVGPVAWVMKALAAKDQKPGEERILTSPLVLGLAAALVLLVVFGVGLWTVVQKSSANKAYTAAVESLDRGEYRTAIKRFDDFLTAFPKDRRAGEARVFKALANVRQFTSVSGPSWSNGIKAAREMLDSVGKEVKYRDVKVELAELVLKCSEGLADRTKRTTAANDLAEAEDAIKLHNLISGKPGEVLVQKSRFPQKIAEARAAVEKAARRAEALAAMDQGLKEESSANVYKARDHLLESYPDLSVDRAVVERLTNANELIKKAVKLDETTKAANPGPAEDPLGPAVSLAFRAGPDAALPSSSTDSTVFAAGEGFAYAVNGKNGAPIWQTPIGHDLPFPPVIVPGSPPSLLVFDSRYSELVKLEGGSGKVVWRQSFGEAVDAAPLVLGNQIFQVVPGGDLVILDLSNGSIQQTLKIGMPLAQTPVADDLGQYLYVPAQESVLFVIARDPLSCVGVEYVGHASGSIPCAPARLGRFLVVVENHEIRKCVWRIYLIDETGARVKPIQRVEFDGWTWQTPVWAGSVVWAVTDRGEVAAYSVGAYDDKEPFKRIAKMAAESEDTGPTFAFARNEHEIWKSSARSGGFDVNSEKGSIETLWSLQEPGPAVAPIQAVERLAVLTHQAGDKPGVALWGVDTETGRVRWRTVLGTPWPLTPTPDAEQKALVTLGIDGKPALIDPGRLSKGGFVELPIPNAGTFRLPVGDLQRYQVGSLALIVPSAEAQRVFTLNAGDSAYKPLELPAPLSAPLLVWGTDLLVPCQDGRVYLIDPVNGAAKAEPFVAPFDKNKPTKWLKPLLMEGDSVALVDQTGIVRRLVKATDPQPRLTATNETRLGSPVVSDPATTGGTLALATEDGKVRALAARDLSPLGAWNIDSRLTAGPLEAGGNLFVSDAGGKLHAYSKDGRRLWSVELEGEPLSGAPVVRESVVWLLLQNGVLQSRSLADGKLIKKWELAVLPAGGLITLGEQVAVPVTPGAVRMLSKIDTVSAGAAPAGGGAAAIAGGSGGSGGETPAAPPRR